MIFSMQGQMFLPKISLEMIKYLSEMGMKRLGENECELPKYGATCLKILLNAYIYIYVHFYVFIYYYYYHALGALYILFY